MALTRSKMQFSICLCIFFCFIKSRRKRSFRVGPNPSFMPTAVYKSLLEEHLAHHRQMVFLSGPKQGGKTTTSLEASSESPLHYYFNWDNDAHRALIIEGPKAVARIAKLDEMQTSIPILVFDLPYIDRDCFEFKEPIIVPAKTFLSQLV